MSHARVGGLSENAMQWLSGVLQTRIAPSVLLRRDGSGAVELALADNAQSVRFVGRVSEFYGDGEIRHCAQWDCEKDGWRAPLHSPLPAPFGAWLERPVQSRITGRGIDLHYDLPGLLFWCLTRSEESDSARVDEHGRFPGTASHAYMHGYLERPFLDEWIEVLRQMVQRLWPRLRLTYNVGRVEPSHDVDFPSRYALCSFRHFVRTSAIDVLKRSSISAALRGTAIRAMSPFLQDLDPRDPYNTFGWIMQCSEDLGLRSQFYFVCGGVDRHDPGYSPRHPAIRRLMRRIYDRGHLVGLHPSYACMGQPTRLIQEAETLRSIAEAEKLSQESWGARMHYLRCRYPGTWHHLHAAGLQHDASMGYADRVGFRAGTCHPYTAFDAEADASIPVEVRPLVVMEGSLYSESYMGLASEEAVNQKLQQLREACFSLGGAFSLLWHNSELESSQQRNSFRRALGEANGVVHMTQFSPDPAP